MQYINGNDISEQSIQEVYEIATSTRIPWKIEQNESNNKYVILSHSVRGVYLNKGVCELNISPEKLYDILYNIKLRSKWDYHCSNAEILEEYDLKNHIIHLKFTNPLFDNLEMNLYRSCRYDPQTRIFVIAMRSIELDDFHENQFECLPNGWVIQGLPGQQHKCRFMFIQQCQERDIDLQRVPGYKSFDSKETKLDFKYLTLFPATVCGRLGTIFEALESFINNENNVMDIQDSRLSIMEKAEKDVNEMFGTTNPDYGWKNYLKKLDMEILIKKTPQGYYMIGKGSFSSVFPPSLLADVLYHENPFEWDTFYDKTQLIENISDNVREVEVHYRMWRNTISMRMLQSVKKGPGNFSAVHWRSICSPDYKVNDGIEVHYLPTGLLNYGLGEGSFTSFLAAIEVKGYPTPWEEEMVTKLFAARIISNQNSIMNHVNKLTNYSKLSRSLPVIPSIENHCGKVGPQVGSPQVYNEMVENFANILLNENNKDSNIASSKNKRKRNGVRDDDEGENNNVQQQQQQQQQQIPPPQQSNAKPSPLRPSLKIPGLSVKNSQNPSLFEEMEQPPIQWNLNKKQPFMFLVSDNGSRKGKLQRKTYTLSNSNFDQLPEELIQTIFNYLYAEDIINVSLVCKRFRMTTDNATLWKNLYNSNKIFNKLQPIKKHFNVPLLASNLLKQQQENTAQQPPQLDGADQNPQQQQQQPQMIENSTLITPQATDNHHQPQQIATNNQQNLMEMAGININDPISLLMTLTNGNIPPNLGPQEIQFLTHLVSQINFTDFSNIEEILSQLPEQIMALIPMETIQIKIQEMKVLMRIVSGLSTAASTNTPAIGNGGPSDDSNNSSKNGKDDKNKKKNENYIPLYDELVNWKAQYTERYKQSNRWSKLKPSNTMVLNGHTKPIKSVKTEGNSAVSIANEKKVRFWNLNSGECIGTYDEPQTSPVSIEYDRSQKSNIIWPISDYTKVYVGFKNGIVSIVDFFEQPIKGHQFNRPTLLADGFDFSYHGKFFIWETSIIELWDVETSARLWQEPASHSKKIIQAKLQVHSTICNDGIALTTSSDKTAKIWNLSNGQLISTLTGHTNAVNCIESIGDYLLLTGGSDKTLKLWDLRNASTPLVNIPTSHTSPIRSLSYQESNGIVLSGSDDGNIIGWSLDNWSFHNIENPSLYLTPTTKSIINGNPEPECTFENTIVINPYPSLTPQNSFTRPLPNILNTTTDVQPQPEQQIQYETRVPKLFPGTFKEKSKVSIKSPISSIDTDDAGFICGSSNGQIFRWDFNN